MRLHPRWATRHLATFLILCLYISPALVAAGGFVVSNRARLVEITEQLMQDTRVFQGTAPLNRKMEPIWPRVPQPRVARRSR